MRKKLVNGLAVAVLTAGFAVAAPVSIDFNVGSSPTHSGEPDNAAGLTLPGQVGAWNAFTVAAVAGAQSITTAEGPTFTINPAGGGPGFNVYAQTGSALRGDIIAMNNQGPVPWQITGLVPNGKYSLIFFQRTAYAGAYTTIDGVGLGTTEPTEKDYDFTDVVADGTGRISGTFSAPTATWYSWAGLQFEQTGVGTPDTTPPTITELSPTNNATDVLTTTDLVITFDEFVQKGTGNIVIKETGGSTFETIDVTSGNVTVNGAAVTINPGSDLAAGAGYYVEIDSGAIKDLASTPNDFAGITGSGTWSFTTDGTAPTIDALAPGNGETGVQPVSDLVITFSEAVQKGSGNIVIQKSAGGAFETIPVSSGSVTVNGATVTINPGTDLAPYTGYFVEIDNGAIKDLSGNDFAGISGSGTWSFTTGKVPTVVSIDFDSNNVVFSGEPTHTAGITIPGQVGPWYRLPTAGSPGSPTIATPGGTFTFNTTGAAYLTFRNNDGMLRNDFFYLSSGSPGPITWTLTELTPGATYDIICYGQYIATTYYVGAMSIVGYNDGNPVTRETSGSEGDWNFPGVVADAAGTITGIFAWETGTSFAVFGAIQFDKVADPLPSGTVILLK